MAYKMAIRTVLQWARFFLLQAILKGDVLMMAMFFAQRVILGKTKFADVPTVLKPQVLEILTDSGLAELAQE